MPRIVESPAAAREHPAATPGNAGVLDEVLRRIVDAYAPSQVYLLGSEARGAAGGDIDIDFAVVVPDGAEPALESLMREASLMTEFAWILRYPRDAPSIDRAEAERALVLAARVLASMTEHPPPGWHGTQSPRTQPT